MDVEWGIPVAGVEVVAWQRESSIPMKAASEFSLAARSGLGESTRQSHVAYDEPCPVGSISCCVRNGMKATHVIHQSSVLCGPMERSGLSRFFSFWWIFFEPDLQVVRGKVTTRCLWNACRALAVGIALLLVGTSMAVIGEEIVVVARARFIDSVPYLQDTMLNSCRKGTRQEGTQQFMLNTNRGDSISTTFHMLGPLLWESEVSSCLLKLEPNER